mmetsp:Transcript_21608/g.36872  ORF Transcript_21608/g.36872 Transcript_21608/m.36872 type:complete len:215 (+) Transcript_21608:33-677(+)
MWQPNNPAPFHFAGINLITFISFSFLSITNEIRSFSLAATRSLTSNKASVPCATPILILPNLIILSFGFNPAFDEGDCGATELIIANGFNIGGCCFSVDDSAEDSFSTLSLSSSTCGAAVSPFFVDEDELVSLKICGKIFSICFITLVKSFLKQSYCPLFRFVSIISSVSGKGNPSASIKLPVLPNREVSNQLFNLFISSMISSFCFANSLNLD